MFELLLPSWIAGLLLSLICGPLGSFVVWRKMAYFGDTLAHASLLGLTFGFLLNINLYYGVIVITLIIAAGLFWLSRQQQIAFDSLLGIIAPSALSLGLITLSLSSSIRIDLMGYLFGDLLAITNQDLFIIAIGVASSLLLLFYHWRSLLLVTISRDLAFIKGISIEKTNALLIFLMALTIGLAMKFVGALIITALLIIPAATARRFAHSPLNMVFIAILLSIMAITGGLALSVYFDTPTGPSVVCCATVLFLISLLKRPTH